MNSLSKRFLRAAALGLIILVLSTRAILAGSPSSQGEQNDDHSPAALMQAVNELRLENGLPTLNAHPALMQVAQWEADAIAGGAPGHVRPEGLTLGQWMISLGYPLAGSIALDGYRSENWTGGTGKTVDEAIIGWLGDAPHTNTMLSPNRSDIGAGVAVREDGSGQTVYIYVIETALQTSNGQQQYEALMLLTELPQTQAVIYGDGTQAAEANLVSQYMVPVVVGTALPDGDVIHEVKYGQSLWSIAIAYGVKIDEIKRLNNLANNEVFPNQVMLIQKGATLPAPTKTETAFSTKRATAVLPSPTIRSTPTQIAASGYAEPNSNSTSTLMIFFILILLVPSSLVWLILKESRRPRIPPTHLGE